MMKCALCGGLIPSNRSRGCEHHIVQQTCYVTTVSGIRCNQPAPAFNMCEHHMMLLERIS